MKRLLAFVPILLLCACLESGLEPAPSIVRLGEDFRLGFGGTAVVEGTNLTLRFADVGTDSRCPIDMMCFWAGNADVHLEISGPDSTFNTVVNTTLEPRELFVLGCRIALKNLEPHPISTKQIEKKDYVATLKVNALIR